MDVEPNKIQIRSIEGHLIEFDPRIKAFSKLIQEANTDEELPTKIPAPVLKEIQNFFELHNYSDSTIWFKNPNVSDVLKDNIDPISFQVMEKYFGIDEEHQEMINPLIQALYYLDIEKFKEICLVTIGVPFFISDSEKDLEEFAAKWGLQNLTPEEEQAMMKEHEPIFAEINQVYAAKMAHEQEKYEQLSKQFMN